MNDLNDESKSDKEKGNQEDKLSIEDQLKNSEDKLLRSLAEIENQRNRFEKEIKEAIDFGSFNFARESLAILDNLRRAYNSIKNDESLKTNKDLSKFLKNIEIIEKTSGVIAGGSYSCRNHVITANMAFKHGNITTFNVGVNFEAERSIRIREKRLKNVINTRNEDRQSLREITTKSKHQMTKKHEDRKAYYQKRLIKTKPLIVSLEKHLKKAKSRLSYNPDSKVFVHNFLYANMQATISGSKIRVDEDMKGVGILTKPKHGAKIVPIEIAQKLEENKDLQESRDEIKAEDIKS